MKTILVGYGKMGKTIEEILLEKGHQIIGRFNRQPEIKDLKDADVAIEFSKPETAFENIAFLLKNGVPVVSGTTGWLDRMDEIRAINEEFKGAFLYGSNFSLGVNLFFELNEKLAKLMKNYPQYQIEIEETHHVMKLDKPSGTAISLAEQIIKNTDFEKWESDQKSAANILPVFSKRIENIAGTHIVTYQSEVDSIEIKHTAHSRKGFALGAVLAAEWIIGKQGCFSMKDVLELI